MFFFNTISTHFIFLLILLFKYIELYFCLVVSHKHTHTHFLIGGSFHPNSSSFTCSTIISYNRRNRSLLLLLLLHDQCSRRWIGRCWCRHFVWGCLCCSCRRSRCCRNNYNTPLTIHIRIQIPSTTNWNLKWKYLKLFYFYPLIILPIFECGPYFLSCFELHWRLPLTDTHVALARERNFSVSQHLLRSPFLRQLFEPN